MKVGEVIVKRLTNIVFKYKLYPALMLIMSVFLSLTVVAQNISISQFLSHMLYHHQQSLVSYTINHYYGTNRLFNIQYVQSTYGK